MTMALKLQEQKEIGALENSVKAIRNGKGTVADELVMKLLGIDKTQYVEISDMIDAYPDKSDWDIAEAIING